LIKDIFNEDIKSITSNNVGGLYNINIDNENSNNNTQKKKINNTNFIIYNKNNNNNLNKKQNHINLRLNVRIAQPSNNHIDQQQIKDLNCFLKFFLFIKIANKTKNISNYENLNNVEEVLKLFKNNLDFKEDNNSNILDYLKYLDNMDLNRNLLLENLFKEKQEVENEIINYWKYLSKYEKYNNDFEHKLFEDLKNCHLDYSIININILERYNSEEYEHKKKECKNMKKMILYHISEINADSNKLNMELEYSNKSIYGKGFYFSDSIDYILKCQNNGEIPEIGEIFSLMACEIFYDEEKLKEFDINLSESGNSSQNSSSNDQNKVEPDGLIKVKNCYLNDNNSKRIIYTEYVLSEKYQIFPLYNFTLRRNEYFVLYRDPNFLGKDKNSKDLKEIILISLKYSNNKNFYFESSTEEALKLILKKKNVKVILITSIGLDKGGKRFVEIARKILHFDDLKVLFFTNNTNHLGWIKDFPNCLFAKKFNIYEEYIKNYNYNGLKNLQKKIEDEYFIRLFGITPYFLNLDSCYNDDDNNKCDYFRSVYVYILIGNKKIYLTMTKEGKVKKSEKECIWDITLYENDITFFSNGFYLNIDKKKITVGTKNMKTWPFEKEGNSYFFFNNEEGKKNYLSIRDDEDIRFNEKDHSITSKFQLYDI